MHQDPDAADAHRHHVQEIATAQSALNEALIEAEMYALPPDTPLHLGDLGPEESLWRQAHAFAINYRQQLLPFSEMVSERWEQPLYTARLPTDEISDPRLPPRAEGDTNSLEVSLSGLSGWRGLYLEWEESVDEKHRQSRTETHRERLWLPIRACWAIYEQLNDILGELGLVANVAEVETEVAPVPAEVDPTMTNGASSD